MRTACGLHARIAASCITRVFLADAQRAPSAGGAFDPLNLAGGDEAKAFSLKEAEIKHGRLAMVACLGYAVQAFSTGEGVVGSLNKFVGSF